MSLNPYMAWCGEFPEEGAVLVFARTAREAKPLGFAELSGWCSDITWTDLRVRRLRKHRDYVMGLRDPQRLDTPHTIDDPPSCERCHCWGVPLDEADVCTTCREDEAQSDA